MSFMTPEERSRLIETQGVEAYERAMEAERRASVIKTVAGHELRHVNGGRFGTLVNVGTLNMAFASLAEAEAYAIANPKETK